MSLVVLSLSPVAYYPRACFPGMPPMQTKKTSAFIQVSIFIIINRELTLCTCAMYYVIGRNGESKADARARDLLLT